MLHSITNLEYVIALSRIRNANGMWVGDFAGAIPTGDVDSEEIEKSRKYQAILWEIDWLKQERILETVEWSGKFKNY